MIKSTPASIDTVISDFFQLLVVEVKKEKNIDISDYINKGLDNLPIEKVNIEPSKDCRGYINYQDKFYPISRCEFIYKKNFTNWATREKHSIGDQCTKNAMFDCNYCSNHKNSTHAKNIKKKEYLSTKKFNEYYTNPSELIHLYDNIFADNDNFICMRMPDHISNLRWKLICWSKVDPDGNRILCSFRPSTIDELNQKQKENNYNYIVEPSLYNQTRRDYSEYQKFSDSDSIDDLL